MADLPKVDPVTIVMESEKYYDFDPSSFQRVSPTLKTVGGGIADLVVPQTATEVAMYAIPPVAVYNKVQKILNRAEALKAQARSIYNYVSEFGGSSKQAKIFEQEAKKLIDDIPKKDRKIHDDYEKSLMGTKEDFDRNIAKLRESLRKKNK
jgi:DNA integrity scanning protein DisA with diadenylate cyclase activity